MRGGNSQAWRDIVAPYTKPDAWTAASQLLNTGLPFLALMAAMLFLLDRGIWAGLLLAVPAAPFLVRLFTIQHDCGHGSFLRSRRLNDLVGRALGVLTLTPYALWRKDHAVHHATSGNLDRRGVGDVDVLTVREYLALPRRRRLLYRLYRNPLIMFGIGPAYLFFIRYRIPTGNPRRHAKAWASVMGTNAVIAGLVVAMALTVGLKPFLLSYLPVALLAASIGVWLFYVQHQFEGTYWRSQAEWEFGAAAMQGCSYYDLPRFLHWLTGHIGLHHVHHLCSRIPNYRLRDCFEQNPEFWQAKRLTLLQSLKCARLALWDEERQKLIGFRQIAR